jgi:hypothetical protein
MGPGHPLPSRAEPASVIRSLPDSLQVYGRPPGVGANLGGSPGDSRQDFFAGGEDFLAAMVCWVLVLALFGTPEPLGNSKFNESQDMYGAGASFSAALPARTSAFSLPGMPE